jgi:hypothetical protein
MAPPISHLSGRIAAHCPDRCEVLPAFATTESFPAEETPRPARTSSEENRDWTWRAIGWVLLANLLLFWSMTCIIAFAQVTAA